MTTSKSQVQAIRGAAKWRITTNVSLMVAVSLGLLITAGCGGMVDEGLNSAQPGAVLKGNVHGGQQPVALATIQLYAAQATGYGALSQPLIGSTVMTDNNGNFTITGDYSCPAAPNDQVYLVATTGNSGSGANANLALMTALGSCANLLISPSTTFISVNEVTTVASAYALTGFMTDYKHVGSSSTNYVGLKNAFATVTNLVDIPTGVALAVTPAYVNAPTGTTSATFRSVVPQAEINTLANIIATCVNTNGVGGSSTNCATLFGATKPSGGSTPADTIQAALNIALYPGSNVPTLWGLPVATAPFGPTLSTMPNDWTIALNFIGGGLGGPSSPVSQDAASSDLAIDASGNVWISNFRSSKVTELTNLGAPLTTSTVLTPSVVTGGYSGGGLSNPNAIAIDNTGNAWMANSNGTLSELTSNGSPVGTGVSGSGLSGTVRGVAIDGNNDVWAASAVISEFDNSGNPLSGVNGYSSNISSPTGAIAIDPANNVWVVSGGNGEVVKLSGTNGGALYSSVATLTSATPYASLDGAGQLWVPQGSPNSDVDVFSVNSTVATTYTPSSASNVVSSSIDGGGHVWLVNAGGALGLSPNVTELSSTGSLISPGTTGYEGVGTALISSPRGSGVDSSGNLWIANDINVSTVTEFVGIGTPTITPLVAAVKGNTIGTKP